MADNTSKNIRSKVIYQIFTRNYKSGGFRAVEEDLERIKALGVDILYLLPIHPCGAVHRKGSCGSPYAIKDYRAIDPAQGTMEDFIHLTQSAHAAGMQIMLDVVYNHTSPDSWLAKNHPEWFFHKDDGSFGNRIGDWWDVIDLDYSHMDLWDYQIETLKLWAQYADGFRCDVAPLVPLAFWERARREIETVRPGCFWLAESVEPPFITNLRKTGIPVLSDGELYRAFDICYDYDTYSAMAGTLRGECSLKEYLRQVNWQEAVYPDNYSKLRCLENHDRPRAATLVPDEAILQNWTAWIYFAKGPTMLYAGEECCATHHPTLFDPDPVDFSTGKDISAFLAKLGKIKKSPLFAYSSFHAKTAGKDGDIILAVHEANADAPAECASRQALGIFSASGRRQALKIGLPDGCYTNAITGQAVDVFEKTIAYDGTPVILFT